MTVSFWQRAEERMQSRVRGPGNVPCAVLTKGSVGSDPDAAISREQKAPDRISLPHGARRYSATSRVLPVKSTEMVPKVLIMRRELSSPGASPQAVRMASLPFFL